MCCLAAIVFAVACTAHAHGKPHEHSKVSVLGTDAACLQLCGPLVFVNALALP